MSATYKFLVVEGCNGVGKSTVVEYLKERTSAVSFHYPPEFVSFRNQVQLDESVAALPRLTYYLAATLHLSELVRERLRQGQVICDRYLASPLSLMIAQSAIAEATAWDLVQPFKPHLLQPDLTLLLTASHAVAGARIRSRYEESGKLTPVARRTVESEEFFRSREEASRRIAARLSQVMELDTTHLSHDEVCCSAWNLVAPILRYGETGEREREPTRTSG